MVAVCSNANVYFFERNPALDIPAALLDLDGVTAAAVLHTLEDSRFLERPRNGRFIHSQHHDFDVAVNHR